MVRQRTLGSAMKSIREADGVTEQTQQQVVMYDSDEAAQYRTDICGWVSRLGIYFGDGFGAERAARFHGCTHQRCRDCGVAVEASSLVCQACQDKLDREGYESRQQEPWDGVAAVYSEKLDRYYDSPESAFDDLEDGMTAEDLRLLICTPNYVSELEPDYCCDEMADDGYLPGAVLKAMEDFNAAVAGVVISWSPGDKRLQLS